MYDSAALVMHDSVYCLCVIVRHCLCPILKWFADHGFCMIVKHSLCLILYLFVMKMSTVSA